MGKSDDAIEDFHASMDRVELRVLELLALADALAAAVTTARVDVWASNGTEEFQKADMSLPMWTAIRNATRAYTTARLEGQL